MPRGYTEGPDYLAETHAGPVLSQCLGNVCDVDPALGQHWVVLSGRQGDPTRRDPCRFTFSKHPYYTVGNPALILGDNTR